MTPDQLRALADALDEITPVMGLEELHHMETLDRAADYLRACAEQRPVAWLHDVVQDGDEPDEALSFYPDSFPLENVGGFRSIGCKPLFSAPAAPQAEPLSEPLSEKQIADACLRYRNDFGLLDKYERDCIVNEAWRWADAFGIGGSDE